MGSIDRSAHDEPERGGVARSRTAARREALAITALAGRLAAVPAEELARIVLAPELRQAIEVSRGLARGARPRQKRLIAKLLRGEDHLAILAALDGGVASNPTGGSSFEHGNEAWRVRLLEGGDTQLEEFVQRHVRADRTKLRQLIRNASRAPDSQPAGRAAMRLLRVIAEARAKGPED